MPAAPAVTPLEAPVAVPHPRARPPLVPVRTDPGPGPRLLTEPLGRLPGDWDRLHDVVIGEDTVDLLLVGPNGLFAVHIDPDQRPAAVRAGRGLFRTGVRDPDPVKRALRNAEGLRRQLADLPGDLLPYPVLVASTPGETGLRLGRLLIVRPGRLAEVIWSHVSRPLKRSERRAVLTALADTAPAV